MPQVITTVSELTPTWLTDRLRQKDVLQSGWVTDIYVTQSLKKNSCTCYYLHITYSDNTNHDSVPVSLFLKISNPGFEWLDDQEVDFYKRLLPMMQSEYTHTWPFLTYYDTSYSQETNQWHLLFEDISTTHFATEAQIPPTADLGKRVADSLAYFHSFWWEHPRLGQDVGEFLTNQTIDDWLTLYPEKLSHLMKQAGSQLSTKDYKLLKFIISAWPARRRERIIARKGLTLIHRDLNPLNILYPRNAETDTIKLIDWQSWRVDTGTDDLAWLIGVFWSPEYRHRFERVMLERYYEKLIEFGVESYTWDDCQYDYRASIIRVLSILIMLNTPAIPALKRSLEAFKDWKCQTIL